MKCIHLAFFVLLSLGKASLVAESTPYDSSPEGIAHLLNRVTFGPRPLANHEVCNIGIDKFLSLQLHPDSIAVPTDITQALEKLTTLTMTPAELVASSDNANNQRRVVTEASQARLIRAIESPQQLYEVMVNFWYMHFNITPHKELDQLWAGAFERDAIRPHAMGNFRELLLATAQHPAMLYHLDNWQNKITSRQGLNRNYAREVIERHILGRDASYTEEDITALTLALTGWGFTFGKASQRNVYTFRFDDNDHDRSSKNFLGHTIQENGLEEGKEALEILAQHPATAQHISYKLAQYFVSDEPVPELVKELAQRFQDSGGEIRIVLQALFDSKHFWDETLYGQKLKTPYEFVVSSVRASGISVTNYQPLINSLGTLNMPLQGHDGFGDRWNTWLTPDGLFDRISFSTALASGQLPLLGQAEGFNSVPQPDRGISPEGLQETLNGIFSKATLQIVREAPVIMRTGLLLGSPDFMRR